MIARLIHLFPVLVCLVPLLSAQQAGTSLIGTDQGLSQGMVFDILQSRDGFLWIGTKDGLNRYDGYRFEVFVPDAFNKFSIASAEIQTIFEDRRGWLWLCYTGGIDVFDPASGRFVHLPVRDIEGFTGYNVSFFEDTDGTIWVAAGNGVLKIRAPETAVQQALESNQPFPQFICSVIKMPEKADGPKAPWLNSVFRSKDSTLLVATTGGLFELDPVREKLSPRPVALPDYDMNYIGQDRAGRLWFSSQKMLCCIKEMQAKPDFMRQTILYSNWLLDAEGNIWGRKDGNLGKWNPDNLAAGKDPDMRIDLVGEVPHSEAFYITSMLIDRSGNIWAGTSGYGLLKKAIGRPRFNSYQPGVSHINLYEEPSSGRIFTLRDVNTIYAGRQFSAGLPNPWFLKFPTTLPVDFTVFDPQGNCWVRSSNRKICRIDAGTKESVCFEAPGYGLWAASDGRLLSLSEEGLYAFDPEKKSTRLFAFDQTLARRHNMFQRQNLFYESRDGALWIFAYEGLMQAKRNGEGYRFEHFLNNPADRSSLSSNIVMSAVEDPLAPQRYLWVGTRGGGLNRLDLQTGKFRHFTTAHGLPDNVVYGILTDGTGKLWLSTNKGLCRFNTRDFSVNNFTAADGLQDNEFNQGSFLKTSDGYLIFGGVNGLTVFHPDSLRLNKHVPPVHVVGLRVNNAPWPLPGNAPLELTFRQNVLTIEIAALDFMNPAQNRYRYQLLRHGAFFRTDESEGEWADLAGNRTVQLVNLSPGRYTFRAHGSNNNGIWSTKPAVLHFTISPPWWASWWAYLLYAATFVAAVAALYQYQLRRRLARQETLRLRELDNFKNRLFTNITHEFRTPLTVILGTVEQLAAGRQATGPAVELIRRNGQNLLRLINQVLDLSKLESDTLAIHYVNGDLLPYMRYIVESLHSFANAQNVLLRVESSESRLVMDYDPERIRQIVYNLLSNAVKFTPGGGKVTLSVSRRAASAVLEVRDTGVGIPPDDLPHIFERFYQAKNLEKAKSGGTGIGLALTRELVGLLGGEITVQSEVGRGSSFEVRLPMTQNAAPGPANVPPVPDAPSSMPKTEGPQPSDERPQVLLIEDNPDVMEYLSAALGHLYHLDFAYNGRAGIEKALETVPDLIISDVMMPEKDGFEVCETLKNDERTSHIPLVLLTAKAGVENRIAGLRRGADAYIAKPFYEAELTVVVENLLEVRKKLRARYAAWSPVVAPPPPDTLAPPPPLDPEQIFLAKLTAAIEAHLDDSMYGVPQLSRQVGLSQSQLYRKIKALTDLSTAAYIRRVRLLKGKEMLETTELTMAEIAYAVGFSTPNYFSDAFAEEFGVRPNAMRN